MARSQPINVQQPLGGLNRAYAFQSQPPFTLVDSMNVRCRDVFEQRARLGSRPCLIKAFADNVSVGGVGVQGFQRIFYATQDVFIDSLAPNTNLNFQGSWQIRKGPSVARSLLYFDLSIIPATATIISAVFFFYRFTGSSSSGSRHGFQIFRLTRTNWGETTATWNKYDGTNNWTTAGGDFSTNDPVAAEGIIVSAQNVVFITHTVRDAVLNRSGALHLMFKYAGETGSTIVEDFFYGRTYSLEPLKRPFISVTYEV
jgi:hypothetical protein